MSTLASVVIYDVIASRPAAGISGRMFYASDTGDQYRDNGASWDLVGALVKSFTFATLPASPFVGKQVVVTDSNTNTWGATVAGGGANTVLTVWDGTNWTVIGK